MRSKQKAAYGSWVSPITPDLMLGASVGLGEPQYNDGQLYWLEMRPEEKGRYVIVTQDEEGKKYDVIPEKYNARTRVHEYGGASYLVCSAGVFFCHFSDQAIYKVDVNQKVHQVTHNDNCRYADFILDAGRQRLVCVREEHPGDSSEAVNTITAIDLNTGEEQVLVQGSDFYSNPRLSPDGDSLCWIEWDHPNMPWDDTRLCLAGLNPDGNLLDINMIAGGKDESVSQPRWSPDNVLYFVSDNSNWWNLFRYKSDHVECVYAMDAEFSVPQWSFGEENYDFIDADNLLGIYWQDGIARLGRLDIDKNKLQALSLPFTDMEGITYKDGKAWCIAASPDNFPCLVEIDISTSEYQVIRKSNELHLDRGYLSFGESVSFYVNDHQQAHAFFYAPANAEFEGPEDTLPPLLVLSHGGPTGASHNGLKMVVQYFTSRGFAVMDVNYGGSSGYGRKYRQRLNGNWGLVDVNDCSKAALFAVEQGWVDPDKLAIRGGSAGGFTTLAALAFTDVFKAGASHYGVSDLEALAQETHKFESRYLDSLIGPYPEAKKIYQQRSPINAVESLSCPVIFFQGLEDKIVLPNQAEMMVEALKSKGIPVVYLAYEGEQHGFRQAKNIKRTLESELYFYSRIFGFECADNIEPVSFVS